MTLARAVAAPPGTTTVRRFRGKRWLIAFTTGVLLLASFWLFRAPLLRGAANAWIVSDSITTADAVVVLGGGLDLRPFGAAKLYTNHVVPMVLVVNVGASPTEELGLSRPHAELNREVLLRLGVPAENIQMVGKDATSTYEEALAVREWAQTNAAKKIIIVTDDFHTRRVRWLYRKVFAESSTQVLVEPLEPHEYSRRNWWQHEQGLVNFQNEILKYLLYRWKY